MKRTVEQIIEYLKLSNEGIVIQGAEQLFAAYEQIATTSEMVEQGNGYMPDISANIDMLAISGVSIDSRTIQPDYLFVPLVGERSDGHDYRTMAYEKGSLVSIWDRKKALPAVPGVYLLVDDTLDALQTLAHQYRKSLTTKVIAITGSNGKTTTKDFLLSMLGQQYKVYGTQGNLNNHIGVPLTLLGIEDQDQYAVIEMGMNHFGEIARLTEIAEPDFGIITNVGESHIEHFGTREAISLAKFELVETMKSGRVIINFDDLLLRQRVEEIGEGACEPLIVGYGMSVSDVKYRAELVSHQKTVRSSSVLRVFDESLRQSFNYTIATPGSHTIYNALAAIAAAKECAIPDECIQKGIDEVKVTPMRMEITQVGPSYIINDAYNASPTSMKAVITYLATIEEPYKKVVLLGDMMELGELSEEYHYQIGQFLLENSIDHVFAYGESAHLYTKPFVEKSLDHSADYFSFGQENQLVEQLKKQIDQGCVLVVKGSRKMKLERFIQMIEDGEDES